MNHNGCATRRQHKREPAVCEGQLNAGKSRRLEEAFEQAKSIDKAAAVCVRLAVRHVRETLA
jgi:hypothetical protein